MTSVPPAPYIRLTSFTGQSPYRDASLGVSMDNEFNTIQVAINGLEARLALIQRQDGNLTNGSVGPDQLGSGLTPTNLSFVNSLGLNALNVAPNILTVGGASALFSSTGIMGANNDFRLFVSKAGPANVASILFQDSLSSRAEVGLSGDDNLHFKLSTDGITFTEALNIATTGLTANNLRVTGAILGPLTLYDKITYSPVTNSAAGVVPGIFQQYNATGSIGTATSGVINAFNVNVDSLTASGAPGPAGFVIQSINDYNFGGPTATGDRTVLFSNFNQSAISEGTHIYRSYVTTQSSVNSVSGDGGGLGTEKGDYYGFWGTASLGAAAAHVSSLQSCELDICASAGSSLLHKIGLLISHINLGSNGVDAVQGSMHDANIMMFNATGNVGARAAFLLGRYDGFGSVGISSDGSVIQVANTATIAKGIDFGPLTFTGNAWTSTGCTLGPTGALSVAGLTIGSAGMVGDGTTNNNTAFQAALTAAQANGGMIQLPPGVFKLTAVMTCNLAAGKHLTIAGTGAGGTTLFFSGAGGLVINYGDKFSSISLSDFSITTDTVNTLTAITLGQVQSNVNPGYNAFSNLTNIFIGGDTFGTHYFAMGIAVNNVSNVIFKNTNVTGPAGSYSTFGTGIKLTGLPGSSTYAAAFEFLSCTFNLVNVGIWYDSWVQGVSISGGCNFTGCNYGVYVPSSAGVASQLNIFGNQFNCGIGVYLLKQVPGASIQGNTFLVPAAGIGINLEGLLSCVIGNAISALTVHSGIGIQATFLTGEFANIISNNQIVSLATGIAIGASCSPTLIGNTYGNNTINVANSSTAARIADFTYGLGLPFSFNVPVEITGTSTILGAGNAAAHWNPLWFGNAGTATLTRFNRLLVGEASLAGGGVVASPQSWVDILLAQNVVALSQLASGSAVGGLGLTGYVRSTDYRTWAAAATGGAQGITGIAYNDDTTGAPIVAGAVGIGVRATGVTGVTLGAQFDMNNVGSVIDVTPTGGVIGGSTFALGLTAGAYTPAAANVSAGLYFGIGLTKKFRRGIIAFATAFDPAVGAGGVGVFADLASGQSVRWLNAGSTVDAEVWGDSNGFNVTGAIKLPVAANGAVATVLGSVGPAGAHTTVQEWIQIKGTGGATRYIPAF